MAYQIQTAKEARAQLYAFLVSDVPDIGSWCQLHQLDHSKLLDWVDVLQARSSPMFVEWVIEEQAATC